MSSVTFRIFGPSSAESARVQSGASTTFRQKTLALNNASAQTFEDAVKINLTSSEIPRGRELLFKSNDVSIASHRLESFSSSSSSLTDSLSRLYDLASRATNPTITKTQRDSLVSEAASLVSNINDITSEREEALDTIRTDAAEGGETLQSGYGQLGQDSIFPLSGIDLTSTSKASTSLSTIASAYAAAERENGASSVMSNTLESSQTQIQNTTENIRNMLAEAPSAGEMIDFAETIKKEILANPNTAINAQSPALSVADLLKASLTEDEET